MALEPSILEVEEIYIHLQNVYIWTDQCNVIYQLSNFSIKCCEGESIVYFQFFLEFLFLYFYLVISTELHKHARVKIQASHKASVINGYWKTQSFCKY